MDSQAPSLFTGADDGYWFGRRARLDKVMTTSGDQPATSALQGRSRRDANSKCMIAFIASAVLLGWGAWRCTFFDDEAFSLRRYCLPLADMVAELHRGVEPDPPLYYLVENVWIDLVGPLSPGLMRVPSIVFFLIGLVVLRRAAAAWFDPQVGNATLILAALHPAHLLLGFAARWYSLMFLCVAALMLATERATRPNAGRPRRDMVAPWSLCAALVCYTNYFGVVVVGLAWLVGAVRMIRSRQGDDSIQKVQSPAAVRSDMVAWAAAAVVAAVIYAPWAPAFIRQVFAFPRVGGGIREYGATAARTVVALTSGNLASPAAWWVHGPMAAAGLILTGLAIRSWCRVWHVGTVVAGCLVAGIASHTMLDKYVMTYSGVACMVAAALLVGHVRGPVAVPAVRASRIALVCLVVGWAGCLIHLATGRNWSSLRWLDPFEQAAAIATNAADGSGDVVVASHPAAAYYIARDMATRADARNKATPASFGERMDAITTFAELLTPPGDPRRRVGDYSVLLSPAGALAAMDAGDVADVELQRIVTVESAEFAGDADWGALRSRLAAEWILADQKTLLADPDAELKDRLDPRFKHPRFRIEVLTWDVK